ncbi:MAG: ABC transporter ATP-binding protein [Actinomycetota bacterium]
MGARRPSMDHHPRELTSGADARFWPTLRRGVGLVRAHRVALSISIVLAIAGQGLTIAIPWATGRVVDEAMRPKDTDQLRYLIGLILALAVGRFIVMYLRRIIAGTMAVDIERDLRNLVYHQLLSLSFPFFDRNQTGQIMSRATVDLTTLRLFLGYGILFFTQHIVTILAVTAVLLWMNVWVAMMVLVIVPPLAVIAVLYSRRSQPVVTEAQQALAEVTTQAEESVVGVRVIKAFGQEDREVGRFAGRTNRVFDLNVEATRLRSIYVPVMDFLPTISIALLIGAGGYAVIRGSMSLGDFVTYGLLVALMVMPLRMLGGWIGDTQRFVASSERIFQILDMPTDVAEPADAEPLPAGGGAIRFAGVTFGYDPDRPVVREVDLDIAPGSTVAIIGRTGSGKTTLTQLVPRFYDTDRGRVLVEGVDVRRLRLDELRGAIGTVAEDTYLFSAPIRDNIAFGRPNATDDEVRLAAQRAQAAGFIEELPDGYGTLVGERGLTLSGGQRQRIAIARALLLDPRILILDDATASVDASTEARIRLALEEVMRGRTTLIIAHRLSTIALADRIVVLEDGRVVADGTHEELIDSSPVYREIHDHGLVERRFVDADGDHVVMPVEHEEASA